MLFSVSPSFDANMPWRNTITRWLSDKCIMQDGNLATLELIKLLIEENTIPEGIQVFEQLIGGFGEMPYFVHSQNGVTFF